MLDQVLDHTQPASARPLPELHQTAAGSGLVVLPIAAIRRDPDLQLRADGLDPVYVRRYREMYEEGDDLEAVVVFEDPDEELWLADGFHRLEAAEQAGRTEHAVDLRKGSRLDALRFAAQANQRHGKPWSKADQANAARRLLSDPQASEGMSQRDVARLCGLSHTRVNQIAAELRTQEQARVESVSTLSRAERERNLRLVLERYRAEGHLEIAIGLKVLRGLAALAEGEAVDLDVWERALEITAAEEQARRDALRVRLEAAKERGDVVAIPGAGLQRARPEMAQTTRLRHLAGLEASLEELERGAAMLAEVQPRETMAAEQLVDELVGPAQVEVRVPAALAALRHLLGKKTDYEIAALSHTKLSIVTRWRRSLGIRFSAWDPRGEPGPQQPKPAQAEDVVDEDLDDEESDQAEDEASEDLERDEAEDLDDEESDQAEAEAGEDLDPDEPEDLDDEESDQAEAEAGEDLEPEQPTAAAASPGARQQMLFTGRGPFTLRHDAPEGDIRAALEAVQARCRVGLADAPDIARRVRVAIDEANRAATAIGRTLEELRPRGVWYTRAVGVAWGGDYTFAHVGEAGIEIRRGYPTSHGNGPESALELTLRESKVTLRPKEQ